MGKKGVRHHTTASRSFFGRPAVRSLIWWRLIRCDIVCVRACACLFSVLFTRQPAAPVMPFNVGHYTSGWLLLGPQAFYPFRHWTNANPHPLTHHTSLFTPFCSPLKPKHRPPVCSPQRNGSSPSSLTTHIALHNFFTGDCIPSTDLHSPALKEAPPHAEPGPQVSHVQVSLFFKMTSLSLL